MSKLSRLALAAGLFLTLAAPVSAVSPIRTPESQPKPWDGGTIPFPAGSAVNPEVIAQRKATADWLIMRKCGPDLGGVMVFIDPDFDRDGGAQVFCRNRRFLSTAVTSFGPHLPLDNAISSIVVSKLPLSLSVGMYLDDTWSAHEITLHPGDTIRNAERNPFISNDAYSSIHLER